VPNTQDFPEHWQVGKLLLPTRYVFNPSGDDDGAIVTVPLQALPQLDAVQLAWGIQGWRTELVEALLKSLPKEHRRKLVPIPDTADKMLPKLKPDAQQGLLTQMVNALAGYGIDSKDFDFSQIPLYLRPLVQVVDDRKKIIAEGRDLIELQARCRVQSHAPIQQQAGELRAFPAQFVFETGKQIAGLAVSQYHALMPMDAPDSGVVVQTFADEKTARLTHRQGVLRLYSLQLGDLARQLKKQLPKPLILTYAPLGDRAALEALLIHATLDATCTDLPMSQAAFDTAFAIDKPRFLSVGQTVLRELTDIFVQWQAIRRQLMAMDQAIFGRNLDDAEDQLDALHLNDFVYHIDVQHWRQYPRYLSVWASVKMKPNWRSFVGR
jgi:ATP-dependent helicase HrpA